MVGKRSGTTRSCSKNETQEEAFVFTENVKKEVRKEGRIWKR